MKQNRLLLPLTSVLLASGLWLQAQGTPTTPPPPAPKAKAAARSKAKAELRAKQVDLNSATKDQLTKIPGVTDEIAARIIAGRPYKSKANLVTHKIISLDLYITIKDLVAAKQPGVK